MYEKILSLAGPETEEGVVSKGLGLLYVKEDGSFDNVACNCDGFSLKSNFSTFTITNDGIVFYLPQGKVASAVIGVPSIGFTFQELSQYLKEPYKKMAGYN